MNTCQNCGNLNAVESNFCRFCGTKITARQQAPVADPFDYTSPKPYGWKTDEYQTQNEARRGRQTGYADTPTNPFNQPQGGALAYQQPQQFSAGYRCPHCNSHFLPRVERRISTGGWVTFAILLVVFLPLFWIGLLIKEDVRVCPNCSNKVG